MVRLRHNEDNKQNTTCDNDFVSIPQMVRLRRKRRTPRNKGTTDEVSIPQMVRLRLAYSEDGAIFGVTRYVSIPQMVRLRHKKVSNQEDYRFYYKVSIPQMVRLRLKDIGKYEFELTSFPYHKWCD